MLRCLPAASLSSNSYADLSEGEGFRWRSLSATRWASSANHLYGRAVTSSETWTWLHSPSFRATPLDIKAEADLHFLQGVNQLIGHGWPYRRIKIVFPASVIFDLLAANVTAAVCWNTGCSPTDPCKACYTR